MFIPMEAYYDANTSSVYVQFLQDIGCVDITILNMCTGNYTEYKTDSCMGGASLSISEDEGDYSIVFLLSNGVIYEGVFVIDWLNLVRHLCRGSVSRDVYMFVSV